MDEIRIDNLEVYAYHGVFPEENEKGQLFYVNMVLYEDTREAAKEDDLFLSTNYGEVCQFVTELMQEQTYQLIETVAETVAREVLRSFPLVQALDVEIRKPQAPIGLPFESVSVKIHRGWHRVYVAMGSNIGDKEAYLTEAVEKLRGKEDIGVLNVSTLITTEPYGGVEQDTFLNGVIELRTLLTPSELLNVLWALETEANRERTVHWGPRTLDLDIIFYDKLVMENYCLIIPHVDMENRDFVLKPMVELNPNFRHPILQKTMQQLLDELTAKKLS
ncbi:MAG: 2-amino-4-hydroxy-6-hydroxymethyldihydropteridine diphosphokinase [Lachnospiraceae bacterium]|nr:2-amino-4-hydroxy-6-hydroxymethyldihydropteridine diphosphokinase [Lachnospiraceae bacterium]